MKNRVDIKTFSIILFFFGSILSMNAQLVSAITPFVIASGGGSGTDSHGNAYDYTIGEVMVETYGPQATGFTITTLTQGFQQPSERGNSLNIDALSSNSTCIGGNNGTANLAVITSTGSVTYQWDAPLNTTTALVTNLSPGVYHYHVKDGNFSIDDSVIISEDQVDCGSQLVFYHVVTPNGDGNNDTWVIDGIDAFKESTVEIFNRWGDKVWDGKNYDNTTVVWDGKDSKSGKQLTDATYFYIIKAGEKTYKGWVELIH